MAPFPWRLVTIDIDGTLTTVHGWRRIAEARGRAAAYDREHALIDHGGIDEDGHLKVLFRFATGLSRRRLEEVLEATPKVRRVASTVAALHARGARVALLTHNPRYVIDWYCRRFGFDAGSGGWGSAFRSDRVGPPGRVRADKVLGLERLERRFRVAGAEVCHVGDAWPDARLAPLIGGFVAFNAMRRNVERPADAVLRTRDLADLLPLLERLRPRRPVEGALPLPEVSNTVRPDARPGLDGVRRPRGAAPALVQPPPPQRGRRAPPVPAVRGP